MSLPVAQDILQKAIVGAPRPPAPASPTADEPNQSFGTPTAPSRSMTPTYPSSLSQPKLMSPVPTSVLRENNITTYTLPDGTEFRLDSRGRPAKIERSLSDTQKKSVRGGGSFSDTQEEVDHIIPVALGGTDTPGNLRAAKSRKNISQTVFDFITGKDRLPGEYKPKNRQEGKMIVEWRAIDKYEKGEISLFEAMAAVRNYDNKELVNDFLKEDFYGLERKKEQQEKVKALAKEAASAVPGVLGSPLGILGTVAGQKAADFVAKELKKSRRQGIINDMVGMIGGKRYVDLEDGKSMIFEVGEGLDAHQAIIAEQKIQEEIESERGRQAFIAEQSAADRLFAARENLGAAKFAAYSALTPARLFVSQPSRWALSHGFELLGVDARLTPETDLAEFAFGKGELVRLSQSDDMYGTAFRAIQDKLEEKGIAADDAYTTAFTSTLLMGLALENPFFAAEKGAAKEALELGMRKGLERELGGEISQEGLERIAKEADRIMALKDEKAKTTILQEFIEAAKAEPDIFRPLLDEGSAKAYREAKNALGRERESIIEDTVVGDERFLTEMEAKATRHASAIERSLAIDGFDDITKGIKNSKVFRKEGSLGDTLDEALILRGPNGHTVAVPAKEAEPFFAKGFQTIDSVDAMATRNGFESSEEFLNQVQELDRIIKDEKVLRPDTEAHRYLTKNNKEYAALNERMNTLTGKLSSPSSLSKANAPQRLGAETLQSRAQAQLSGASPRILEGKSSSLPDLITKDPVTPLKLKVNALDYLRTPERVLQKIGLGNQADLVREGYDGYLKELPGNIDKITEWSKRVPKDSNQKIFQYLDGEAVKLNDTEKEVAREIQAWLSEWADRLGLPKDRRIASYITHLFDDQFIAKEFDEDLAKIIADKIPGSVYDPFLMKRLGKKGYLQDTWKALDAYVKRATRKVHMDPALAELEGAASKLEKSQWDFVKKYVDRVNMRPTDIDTMFDNGIKQMVGYKLGQRPTLVITRFLRQMTYRAKLGLNIGSALRNLSQGANTYAKLGEKYTFLGYAKLLSPENHKELLDQGILNSSFVQDRALSATKKAIEKVDKGLFFFFEQAERINRGAAYFGAKSKALAQGKTEAEAIKYAKKIVRDTQFLFGSIDTPQALQSDIVKTLTQFQSYTTKQIEFLVEMAANKEFAGLMRYAVAGMAFVYTIGQAFGMEPKDLIPTYRLGVPASLQLPTEAVKAAVDAPDKFGNDRDLETKIEDVGQAAVGVIPGSSQGKKTVEGLAAIEGQKGLPFWKKAQALIFGKYAAGQDTTSLQEKATDDVVATAKRMVDLPKEQAAEEYDNYIAEHPEAKERLNKEIRDLQSGITEPEKEIRSLGVATGERARAVFKELSKLKTKEEKAALWDDYVNKRILTEDVQEQVMELLQNQ